MGYEYQNMVHMESIIERGRESPEGLGSHEPVRGRRRLAWTLALQRYGVVMGKGG